jgi:ComF family protein
MMAIGSGNIGTAAAGPGFLAAAGAWAVSNLRYAADLILPPVCLRCHAPLASHGVLCAECWRGIDVIRPPLCDRLGHPLPYATGEITLSAAALRRPPLYARARAAAHFRGVMRDLIHAFKYSDRHEAVDLFVRMMQTAGAELIADAGVLVPVPLHRRRLWQRRYNQAAVLARGLARLTGTPADTALLLRGKATATQVGLSGEERRRNVAAAFCLARAADTRLRGRRVLLIDDVITTGATLEACTRVLKDGGAAEVDCLALALASVPGTRDD